MFVENKKGKYGAVELEANAYFVWRALSGACDVCKILDGMKFFDVSEIPDRPHPNCLCWIEYVGGEGNSFPVGSKQIKIEEKEKLQGDSSSLEEEVVVKQNEIENNAENVEPLRGRVVVEEYVDSLKNLQLQILDARKILEARPEFSKNELQTLQQVLNEQQQYYKQLEQAYNKELHNLENPKDNPFIDDIEKHKIMFDLIKHSHNKGGEELLHGYEEVAKLHHEKTSMDVAVYKNDKEVVILFPGSAGGKDFLVTDTKLPAIKENNQYDSAKEVYDAVKNDSRFENHKIIITGYSLGGNTATMIGAEGNHDTVVFAPYGSEKDVIQKRVNKTRKPIQIHPEKVVVYQQEKDKLSAVGDEGHIGVFYKLPYEGNGTLGQSHNLDNFVDLSTRTEPEFRNPKTIYTPQPALSERLKNLYHNVRN